MKFIRYSGSTQVQNTIYTDRQRDRQTDAIKTK